MCSNIIDREQDKKNVQQKLFFGPAFTPPPLLMAWPLVDELFLRLS